MYFACGCRCCICCRCATCRSSRLWCRRLSWRQCRESFDIYALHVVTQHVLRSLLTSHTSEHNAIKEGVSAEAVVAVHTAGNFARGVEPLDGPSRRVNNLGIPRLLI